MNQETTAAASTVGDQSGRGRKSIIPEFVEELVGSNGDDRNWKGMVIALGVILFVIGLVALSVFVMSPDIKQPVVPKVPLPDILNEEWKLPEYSWIGSDLVHKDRHGNVVKISSPDLTPEIIIPKEVLKKQKVANFEISSDMKHALLAYNKVPIYSYSFNASYLLYNIKTGTTKSLLHGHLERTFQFAKFGPKGSSILYSIDGDLFYKPSVREQAVRLTKNGRLRIYQNGIPDWIYEEKVLKAAVAHWFSPSGRYLAYASFDDRKVDDNFVTIYNGDGIADIIAYQRILKYKYPQAGRTNPTVNVHAIDLNNMKTVTFEKPTLNRQRLQTFHSLSWLNDDELLVTWSNRTMTASVMQQCVPTIQICTNDVIRRSVGGGRQRPNSKSGWLTNLNQQALSSDQPGIFFYILPHEHGAMGEFNHLAVINKTQEHTRIRFLTGGNWEVLKLLHYDSNKEEVYYVSNERHPGSSQIFKVNLKGRRSCVSCSLLRDSFIPNIDDSSIPEGVKNSRELNENLTCDGGKNPCRYYDATFGSSSDWFIAKCLGPCLPFSGIARISGSSSRGDIVADEKSSTSKPSMQILTPPTQSLPNLLVPVTRYAELSNDGSPINIKMMIPASIHVGRRPVVFFKNELGSHTADFRFNLDLATYIVTHIGAVGVFVDGSGSSRNGDKLLQSIVAKPGTLEIEDMKIVLKYLKPKENIDITNVAVVGVSGYGGYTAALSLIHPQFKCGVARTLISDWRLYDSFSSESLLGLPEENPLLYERNNLNHLIEGISGSQLRIYHGMQDRDVNMQHSVSLEESVMIGKLPLGTVKVTYLPSIEFLSDPEESDKIESNVYESISLFLRNCLFGNSETGKVQLELLQSNYGIST